MSASDWQTVYPRLQEMQQQWFEGISQLFQHAATRETPFPINEIFNANQAFFSEQLTCWQTALTNASSTAEPIDKRFAAAEWQQGQFAWLWRYYIASSQWVLRLIDLMVEDQLQRARLRFFTQQFLDAMSPANFLLTNPEAIARAIETQGQSLQQGMENFVNDIKQGALSLTDATQFELGVNVATTEGAVIFENELIQLIQYTPLTAQVFARPLLIVPPCINKYYLMDLEPEQSMVRYLVEQGHQVFLISWKSITSALGHLRWDDYVEGVLKTVEVVQAITKQTKINTLGFCIGGVILATAAAVAVGRGNQAIASLALMASMLDHYDQGEIRFFIDEALLRSREARMDEGGVIKGADLSLAFSMLRAKDLIWQPAVDSYLLGKSPPAFNLLYWNADNTNLALPMHTFFLRQMYVNNALTIPGKLTLCGVPIDLRQLTIPAYLFAAKDDHIAPWHSVYASTKLLGGPVRFVLGASGHVAGAINPVKRNKRNYWFNPSLTTAADEWLDNATTQPGSWWQDFNSWLIPQSGKHVPAPRQLGNAVYPEIEPAPGRYVKEKAR